MEVRSAPRAEKIGIGDDLTERQSQTLRGGAGTLRDLRADGKKDYFRGTRLVIIREKDWENLKGGKRKITSDDWNVDSDVKPSASAVKVSVASGTGSAKPQVADVSAKPNPLAEAVKLLEVVRDELKGFFQWLKEKVVEKVGKLWQAVQTAFNTMLGWLRNIWSSIRTSSRVGATAATGSKVHLA
nr:hypothetical protein BaRGS_029623 [Batillaria attramentaria]